MQSKMVYVMMAGLAVGMLSTMCSKATANDNSCFAVLSPKTAIPVRLDSVSRPVETSISYPVVIERNGTMIAGTSLMPVMLERTTVAKRHHLPFSFGVWP